MTTINRLDVNIPVGRALERQRDSELLAPPAESEVKNVRNPWDLYQTPTGRQRAAPGESLWRYLAVSSTAATPVGLGLLGSFPFAGLLALGAGVLSGGSAAFLWKREASGPRRRIAHAHVPMPIDLPPRMTAEQLRVSLGNLRASAHVALPKLPRSASPALREAAVELEQALRFDTHVHLKRLTFTREPWRGEALMVTYDASALSAALHRGQLSMLGARDRAWVVAAVFRTLGLEGASLPDYVVVPGKLRLADKSSLRTAINVEALPVAVAMERYATEALEHEVSRADALVAHLSFLQAKNLTPEQLAQATSETLRSADVTTLSRLSLLERVVAQASAGWERGAVPAEIQKLSSELLSLSETQDLSEKAFALTHALQRGVAEPNIQRRFQLLGALEEVKAAIHRFDARERKGTVPNVEPWLAARLPDAVGALNDAFTNLAAVQGNEPEYQALLDETRALVAQLSERLPSPTDRGR